VWESLVFSNPVTNVEKPLGKSRAYRGGFSGVSGNPF